MQWRMRSTARCTSPCHRGSRRTTAARTSSSSQFVPSNYTTMRSCARISCPSSSHLCSSGASREIRGNPVRLLKDGGVLEQVDTGLELLGENKISGEKVVINLQSDAYVSRRGGRGSVRPRSHSDTEVTPVSIPVAAKGAESDYNAWLQQAVRFPSEFKLEEAKEFTSRLEAGRRWGGPMSSHAT